MARRHQHPTTNLWEVWQNLAPFSGRPICGAVEARLTKVVNWQSSISPIVVFSLPPAVPLLACYGSIITQSNSAESVILSVGGAESMMLSVHAESIILSASPSESMILSVLPAESMILSVPLADATRKHYLGTAP
jgi:hypothetical protein